MKNPSIKFSAVFLVAIIGVVFLNKYAWKGWIPYPKSLVNSGSYLFAKAENFGGLLEHIRNFNHLASENDKLKRDEKIANELRARVDNLEDENEFLRRAARVSQRLDYPVVYGGIFNLNFAPTGYNVLLNKGAKDGISEGDVVVNNEGVLVGKVQKVMDNFSRILFVSDPEFKVTTKVVGSATSGIARGALNGGMYLDFVVQADEIKEEDVLITTGNDLFPPALIIGSVDHVEVNATQMFKKIRIRPAVHDVKLGRVLVIKIK